MWFKVKWVKMWDRVYPRHDLAPEHTGYSCVCCLVARETPSSRHDYAAAISLWLGFTSCCGPAALTLQGVEVSSAASGAQTCLLWGQRRLFMLTLTGVFSLLQFKRPKGQKWRKDQHWSDFLWAASASFCRSWYLIFTPEGLKLSSIYYLL